VITLNAKTTGSGTLATLDTTLLANGSYFITLNATTASQSLTSGVDIVVQGDYKPGRVLTTVTDLEVPAPGPPIQIQRTYDSLVRGTSSDFGYGWSLGIKMQLVDTSIVDLTEQLADPVEVLFGVQLGGGTDINAALAYCEKLIENPAKTHLILITDLYEGGNAEQMLARAASIKQSGVNLIVLLALSDSGHPAYDSQHAARIASLGCPVFACTPDQFPAMMAAALTGKDLQEWAAAEDIALIRSL